mmetsp:Transcript_98261/g.177411  ORF Transcript_98261/g.177411 Transcript_98261/m.177411 type:complete len:389 (+) Transcript_98261:312-1478(+)
MAPGTSAACSRRTMTAAPSVTQGGASSPQCIAAPPAPASLCRFSGGSAAAPRTLLDGSKAPKLKNPGVTDPAEALSWTGVSATFSAAASSPAGSSCSGSIAAAAAATSARPASMKLSCSSNCISALSSGPSLISPLTTGRKNKVSGIKKSWGILCAVVNISCSSTSPESSEASTAAFISASVAEPFAFTASIRSCSSLSGAWKASFTVRCSNGAAARLLKMRSGSQKSTLVRSYFLDSGSKSISKLTSSIGCRICLAMSRSQRPPWLMATPRSCRFTLNQSISPALLRSSTSRDQCWGMGSFISPGPILPSFPTGHSTTPSRIRFKYSLDGSKKISPRPARTIRSVPYVRFSSDFAFQPMLPASLSALVLTPIWRTWVTRFLLTCSWR